VKGLEAAGRALRDRSMETGSGRRLDPAPVREGADGSFIACARCHHAVTSASARIEVAGAHEHTFDNPAGIRFTIGCFSRAACAAQGPPSTYWTWFPGYSWELEACGRCGAHLGWRFRSSTDLFHGLILDRLVELAGGDE
jgi:hypothetical protein